MRSVLVGILAAVAATAAPTYHRDVRPILEARCVACHRPGEIGPMPLRTFAEVRPWAKAIKVTVARGTMSPWHAGKEHSVAFRNDRSLTPGERATLIAWADGGAPEGQAPQAAAASTTAVQGWTWGQPDMVVKVPGFRVPARGTVEYTFLITPTSFPEAKWIRAAEWRIDQRQVVHHLNVFLRPRGSSFVKDGPRREFFVASKESRSARRQGERDIDRWELLLGYEPGYQPLEWGPGLAKLLPQGADLVFEMHYTANGKEAVDYSELGLYFAQAPPNERVLTLTPMDPTLEIPPGEPNHPSLTTATLKRDLTLLAMQPHMHLRGKSYRITATYPDGRKESLLDVPRYDFNWQTTYFLQTPKLLPKDTVIECLAHFDNSPNNPSNPNPAHTVRWGDQSWEEMNIGFMEVAFPAGEDASVVITGTRPVRASAAP